MLLGKVSNKKNYVKPTIKTITIGMENGIAATSTSRLGVNTNANSVQVEDWKNGDGFEETDFSL